MPIRMTDDPDQPEDSGGNFEGGGGRGGGSGGGGGIFSLLPLLLGLIRGPKSLLLVVALGIGAYFILGRGGCNPAGGGGWERHHRCGQTTDDGRHA